MLRLLGELHRRAPGLEHFFAAEFILRRNDDGDDDSDSDSLRNDKDIRDGSTGRAGILNSEFSVWQ